MSISIPSTILRRGLALALLLSLPAAAWADRVYLTNGRVLDGQARELPNGMIEVQLSYGTLALPATRVKRIVEAETLVEVVHETLDRLDKDDAEGRYRLARALDSKGENTLAQHFYQQVLEIDPDHEGARRKLGYQRLGDDWLSDEEVHRRRGEVRFRGEWVSARALAARTAQQLRDLAQAEERRRAAAREAELSAAVTRLELELDRLEAGGSARGIADQPFYLYGSAAVPTRVYRTPVAPVHPRGQAAARAHPRRERPPGVRRSAPATSEAPDRPRHNRGGFKKPD